MKYSVGEVARVLGLTPGALHYFEREGLVRVEKEPNGHRGYSLFDIFRLLAYYTYHSMGITVKTVVEQFSDPKNTRSVITGRLEDCRNSAIKKAEHYSHLVQCIDVHLEGIRRIDSLLDVYEFERSPHVYLLHDDSCGWISKKRYAQNVAHKWVGIIPATRMALIVTSYSPETGIEAVFGYSATKEEAIKGDLPIHRPCAHEHKSVLCLHTIVATDHSFMEEPGNVFRDAIKYSLSRGFTIDGMPWGNILMSEVKENGSLCIYIELWIPVK